MCALVLIGSSISYFYYKGVNESTDPRIIEARILYERYNGYAQSNQIDAIFSLMDSVEAIYSRYDHYRNSFEVGVLYNNRAASYITLALYSDEIDKIEQDSLINLADSALSKSIEIYNDWLDKFQDLEAQDIKKVIEPDFKIGLTNYTSDEADNFLNKRVKEIQNSQVETKRRLSVGYTNQGIIYRHRMLYEDAARSYKAAIDLWDRNLTAENNLNKLLGRPEKKRNLIQKLFPPERDQN